MLALFTNSLTLYLNSRRISGGFRFFVCLLVVFLFWEGSVLPRIQSAVFWPFFPLLFSPVRQLKLRLI